MLQSMLIMFSLFRQEQLNKNVFLNLLEDEQAFLSVELTAVDSDEVHGTKRVKHARSL